jgi:hypothetical protein
MKKSLVGLILVTRREFSCIALIFTFELFTSKTSYSLVTIDRLLLNFRELKNRRQLKNVFCHFIKVANHWPIRGIFSYFLAVHTCKVGRIFVGETERCLPTH